MKQRKCKFGTINLFYFCMIKANIKILQELVGEHSIFSSNLYPYFSIFCGNLSILITIHSVRTLWIQNKIVLNSLISTVHQYCTGRTPRLKTTDVRLKLHMWYP